MAVELIKGLNQTQATAEFRQRLLGILANRMPMTTREIQDAYQSKYNDQDRSFASIYQQLRTMATHGTVVWHSWESQMADSTHPVVTFSIPLDLPPTLDPEGLDAWLSA